MKSLFQKLLVGLAMMTCAMPALAFGSGNTDMELLAEKVKADKMLLVGMNMSLTREEARNFWPFYDGYQKELQPVNQEIGRLIVDFAQAYAKEPLPNETAKKILEDVLTLEEKEMQAKRSYTDKKEKCAPGLARDPLYAL